MGSGWTGGNLPFGLSDVPNNIMVDSPPVSENQVVVPSEMIAMADSWSDNIIFGGKWLAADQGSGLGVVAASPPLPGVINPLRHGKNYNQVYCDGYVGAMPPSVLYNPTNTAALWNRDHQPHPEYWGL